MQALPESHVRGGVRNMPGLRVLITNIRLASRSGTELYVRDLALELLRQNHLPVVFSPQLGPLAEQLREASVPVVDRLADIALPPDVVHGHHCLETMSALLRFPDAAGVFVCHDFAAWHDTPPKFPRLRRYVAVDHACRERLSAQHGIAPQQVEVLYNAVDLQAFRPRQTLPKKPRRALLISNYMNASQARPIQAACHAAGIELKLVGRRLAEVCQAPQDILGKFDLVFAKGRCAWEAMATGTAVVVCDAAGIGPLVSSARLDELRSWNFGRRLLRDPITREIVKSRIESYDANDAAIVSQAIRASASIEGLTRDWVDLYGKVIDDQRSEACNREAELLAASEFVEWWSQHRRQQAKQKARKLRPAYVLSRWYGSLKCHAMSKLAKLTTT
jgi:Glycosyltransferase Family 4